MSGAKEKELVEHCARRMHDERGRESESKKGRDEKGDGRMRERRREAGSERNGEISSNELNVQFSTRGE